MSHVDEGTLHAWLDGELTAAEGVELERHLSVCLPCRNALAEARTFLTESDGMIRTLDVVAPAASSPVAVRPARRFVRFTTLAWAASLIAAIGLGYSLRNAPIQPVAAPVATTEANTPVTLRPAPPAISAGPAAPAVAAQPRAGAETRRAREDAPAPAPIALDQKVAATPRDRSADEIGTANAGAGVTTLATAEPQAATPPPRIAMVEGVPVDTTAAHRAFGPANPPAPRRITMDEAVTHLGGTIRLIDGLTPQRVELLAGIDVVGADPGREVVRIYYEEPDLGLVTLDQQRPGPSFAASRMQSTIAPESVSVTQAPVPSADRLLARGRGAVASLTWRSDGAWLSLTSRLTPDQMASLQARVK